jgi:hypothetical protein
MEAEWVSETSQVLNNHFSLRMEAEWISETSEVFKQLTRL